jgi:hypothetical protein
MRARGIILAVVVLLIVAAVFAWKRFNPGPMAFAGGLTVALADYHAADPTGVPAWATFAPNRRFRRYF